MSHISFLITFVIIPITLWFLNAIVRSGLHSPYSAASDGFLAVMAFNCSVIMSPGTFKPWLANTTLSENDITGIFLAALICAIIMWIFNVTKLEEKVISGFDYSHRKYKNKKYLWSWLFSWIVFGILLFGEIEVFLYKP